MNKNQEPKYRLIRIKNRSTFASLKSIKLMSCIDLFKELSFTRNFTKDLQDLSYYYMLLFKKNDYLFPYYYD